MKNIGGKYFDEAYLILKNDSPHSTLSSILASDLAREAELIVNQAMNQSAARSKKTHRFSRFISFALGAATSSAIIGIAALVFALV